MSSGKWDARIRRANDLTSSYQFAAEGLRFYARLATFQKSLFEEIRKALAGSSKVSSDRPLRDELDHFLLLPRFPGFLSVIEQIAPVPLAQAAASLAQKGPSEWQWAIEEFWHRDLDLAAGVDDAGPHSPDWSSATYSHKVLAWIFLQPYAEYLADHREIEIVNGTPSTCPLCRL